MELMTAWTLARLSLLEITRQRYAWLPVLLAIALVLAGTLSAPTIHVNGADMAPGPDQLLPVANGLLALAGMGLGALVGAGLVAPELERGTVLLLVTKPISRAGMLLGKALGALAFLAASFGAWALIIALLVAWRASPSLAPAAFGAMFAGLAPAALMLAVAAAASTRLASGVSVAIATALWAACGLASLLRNLEWAQLPLMVRVAREASWVVPWTELLKLPGAFGIGSPVPTVAIAALLAIPAWITLAVGLFARRDLG
jgi:ABC-type transport system involved in multi-copper enzyme maturation permease subunit